MNIYQEYIKEIEERKKEIDAVADVLYQIPKKILLKCLLIQEQKVVM